jgi:hypothetical protein
MPTFLATMRVVHVETWEVEAADEAEARNKFSELAEDVIDDDSGGEVVDWEVQSVRPSPL